MTQNAVGQQRCAGDLDHDPRDQAAFAHLAPEPRCFLLGRHHRRHDPHRPLRSCGGLGDGVKLAIHESFVAPAQSHAPDAQRRIRLVLDRWQADRLVRARVECADDDLALPHRLEHLAIDGCLLVDRGLDITIQEAQLGAEQTHTLNLGLARHVEHRRRPGRSRARRQGGRRWFCPANATRPRPRLRRRPHPSGRRSSSAVGVEDDLTGRAVDQHHRADSDVVQAVSADDARDAELAGDDRGVAGRPAQGRGDGHDRGRVQPRGVGWSQIVGAQHRRRLGVGMPGSGWPVSSATMRSRTSLRSVTRSAISPPAAANMALSSSIAATVEAHRPVPAPRCWVTSATSPRSRVRVAVAMRTSEAAPLAWPARAASRSATIVAAAVNCVAPSVGSTDGLVTGHRRARHGSDDRSGPNSRNHSIA